MGIALFYLLAQFNMWNVSFDLYILFTIGTSIIKSAGDFNKSNMRKMLLNFYQHIACITRASKTPLLMSLLGWIQGTSPSPFSKSDHDSILLLPSHRQKLKQQAPVLRSIQQWSDHASRLFCSRGQGYVPGCLSE
jgi:hypothetical protein